MISVVIPTITGREFTYHRCLRAYQKTSPPDTEYITVKDQPAWPHACNIGYDLSGGSIVHFTADDLEPLPGWWEEVTEALEAEDILPAPRVMNHTPDGPWDNYGDGPDGAEPPFTRIPIMRSDQWERIGRWPEVNYVADVWVSEKARTIGIRTRMFHSYAFVHHWEQIGRDDGPEVQARAAQALNDLRAAM